MDKSSNHTLSLRRPNNSSSDLRRLSSTIQSPVWSVLVTAFPYRLRKDRIENTSSDVLLKRNVYSCFLATKVYCLRRGRHRKHFYRIVACLCVLYCLHSCWLATRWSNLLQYKSHRIPKLWRNMVTSPSRLRCKIQPYKWRECVPPKRRYRPVKLRPVTSQKLGIWTRPMYLVMHGLLILHTITHGEEVSLELQIM
jgi:hypothetical protein